MMHGMIIICIVCFFLVSFSIAYFSTNKWIIVEKDDNKTLSEMESLSIRFFDFAENNLSSKKDFDIHINVKNGKVVSSQVKTTSTIKTLWSNEPGLFHTSTVYRRSTLWIARLIVTIFIFVWFLVAFLLFISI